MENQGLKGVLAVVHTPFTDGDEIDQVSFRRQVDWAFEVGADGLGMGMVSETLKLTPDERRFLIEYLVKCTDGRGCVFASVGAESTKHAQQFAKHAESVGCGAVMAIPPISSGVSESQMFDYFAAIVKAVDVPVIVQDASGYVGQPISHSVAVQLLDTFGSERVHFKPESSPLGPNLSRLRDATGGRARILEGSGGVLMIDCFRRGIVGTMPGIELLDANVEVWRALNRGDEKRAYQIYLTVCALVNLQLQAGLDGFLAIEKYLMHQRGLFATVHRRAPYAWELDGETSREVDRLFELMRLALRSSADGDT